MNYYNYFNEYSGSESVYGACTIDCDKVSICKDQKQEQLSFFKANNADGDLPKGHEHFHCRLDIERHGKRAIQFKNQIHVCGRKSLNMYYSHAASHGLIFLLWLMLSLYFNFDIHLLKTIKTTKPKSFSYLGYYLKLATNPRYNQLPYRTTPRIRYFNLAMHIIKKRNKHYILF